MTAKIKFTCELTIRDIDYMPAPGEAWAELEDVLKCNLWDDVIITEYEQEFIEDES